MVDQILSASDARPVAARPIAFRGGGFAPSPVRHVAPALFLVLIVLVEAGTRSGIISNLTLPRPSAVALTLYDLAVSGGLMQHLVPSMRRLGVGIALGLSAGIGLGVLIGLFSLIRAGLVPLVAALFPIPKIALLPSAFEVGRELTRTLTKRREVITEMYGGVIDRLYRS